MLTLVLLALVAGVLQHSATPRPTFRTAHAFVPSARPRPWDFRPTPTLVLMALRGEPDDRPPARPIRLPFARTDPLAKHRAITGINAHVRWYQRVGSLIGIVTLVVLMGVLLAGLVGVAFFGARIALEMLVG